MKIGAMEVKVDCVTESTQGQAHVRIALRACGMQLGAERVTPDQARQLARVLTAAADMAQGRAG